MAGKSNDEKAPEWDGYDDNLELPFEDSSGKQWTSKKQLALLFSMIGLKPAGPHKHINMMIIREKLSHHLQQNVETRTIWQYLNSKWDICKSDEIEKPTFSIEQSNFDLPDEYKQLIAEQTEKIKREKEEKKKKAIQASTLPDNDDSKQLIAQKVEKVKKKDEEEKNFTLPDNDEFKQLSAQDTEKIKKKEEEKKRLNDKNEELKIKKSCGSPNKTRSKSDSISSVDSDDSIQGIKVMPGGSSSLKKDEVEHEEVSSTRRSLRTNDKHEEKDVDDDSASSKKRLVRTNNKLDEPNKSKDLKTSNKKLLNQLKDVEVDGKGSNNEKPKRKDRNVSESSLSSDNSKRYKHLQNNSVDVTGSDSSSRSVTPEISKSKTSNRSITPEVNNIKSNLRSCEKDAKLKIVPEVQCLRLIMPEIKIERLTALPGDKQYAALLKGKAQPEKTKAIKKKGKPKKVKKRAARVTSDLLVVNQSPKAPLGRRSCSNKTTAKQ